MNDIEQQFFNTFEIEPKYKIDIGRWDNKTNTRKPLNVIISEKEYLKGYKNNKLTPLIDLIYPKITAEILLELICMHNIYLETKLYSLEVKDLKDEILQDLIDEQELREIKEDYVNDDLKQQVRSLFEEVE